MRHTELSIDTLISVVVCHHTGDLIYRFLDSIKDSIRVRFEVIVVTSDHDFKARGVRVIHCEDLPARKRNLGVQYADGRYIAFFDDDTEPSRDCLFNLLNTLLKYQDTAMVYGKCLKGDEPNRLDEAGGFLTWTGFIWSRAEQNLIDRGQFDCEELIFSGKSACCMIKLEDFIEVGGFDEDFGILGEESDLSWRLWLQSRKVVFCPTATALHHFNTKLKPPEKFYTSERIQLNGCRNYISMLIKNMGGLRLCLILPIHVLLWMSTAIGLLFTLKIKESTNIIRGLFSVLRMTSSLAAKRRVIQTTRCVQERDLCKVIYRSPDLSYFFLRCLRYLRINLHG